LTPMIYEDRPKCDLWVKVLLPSILIALLVVGFLLYYGKLPAETEAEARTASTIIFACTAFTLLLYWFIFPRKYQILENKIKIVLGGPFSFNVPFDSVETARKTKGLVNMGIGFATSADRLEIVRKGMNVMISPSNSGLFLENLNQAVKNWQGSHIR